MVRYSARTYEILEMPEGLAAATELARRQFEAAARLAEGEEPRTWKPEDDPPEIADLDLENVSAETLRLLDVLMGREPPIDTGQQSPGNVSRPTDVSAREILSFPRPSDDSARGGLARWRASSI